MKPCCLTILGSTGSIGRQTLDIVAQYPDHFSVKALSARDDIDTLSQQCLLFQPEIAVVQTESSAVLLQKKMREHSCKTEIVFGEKHYALIAQLPEVDTVVAAIVGSAGLLPTLAALQSGKRVLLANKESLVMAGDVMLQVMRDNNAMLLPIDSEHNAILQCLGADYEPGVKPNGVSRVWLTASGGPFRTLPLEQFSDVTPDAACAHPTWRMGKKISVDCATMMNKGLEVIEACYLFGLSPKEVNVILHPQSIVHSFVEYDDGALLAQMGVPDMRVPISYVLYFPKRCKTNAPSFDLLQMKQWDFEPLCEKRYPCLSLAYQALKAGGVATTVLNAANEVAVDAFLKGQIRFTAIFNMIEKVLQSYDFSPHNVRQVSSTDAIDNILSADTQARVLAKRYL